MMGVKKKILIEIMYFHYMTHIAKPILQEPLPRGSCLIFVYLILYLFFIDEDKSDETKKLKIFYSSNINFTSGEGKHTTTCILITISGFIYDRFDRATVEYSNTRCHPWFYVYIKSIFFL